MDKSVEFLSGIFSLLQSGNVFERNSEDSKSIADFKHPGKLKITTTLQSLLSPRPSINNFPDFPLYLKELINISLSDNTEPLENDMEIIKLCQSVIKHSIKTNNRNFHNQLFGGLDFYGLGAEWITSALNTGQYTFEMAPVFTLIEEEIVNRSLELFGLQNGEGILCPGGSSANMYGIHLARYSKFPSIKQEGNPSGLVVFTSEESHYSLIKGVSFLGIGMQNLVSIKTNLLGQMLVEDLEDKINEAIKKNLKPFLVNATCGSTVLGAFDDLNEIADVCRKYGLWLHADACLGGSAIFSAKHRHLLNGSSRVNSISWNPHKTMGVPLQCSIFLVNQKGLLHECNSSSANYLFQQDKFYDTSYDTGDKSLSCGRKVDAFKFWLMWKKRGTRGFQDLIDNAFEMANYLKQKIEKREGFKLLIPEFQYTNISFFYIPKFMRQKSEDEKFWKSISTITTLIKEKMMMNGNLMIGYSPLPNKNVGNFFRMVVTCHPPASHESMDFALDQIEKIGEDLEFYE